MEKNNKKCNANLELIAGERPPSNDEATVKKQDDLISVSNVDIANNLDLAKAFIDKNRNDKNQSKFICIGTTLYFYENGRYKACRSAEFELRVRTALNTIPKSNPNSSKIKEVIENIKAESVYDGEGRNNFFINHSSKDQFISMKNGILNLSKAIDKDDNVVELIPLSPAFFNTSILPFDYNPKASCPIFLKILKDILPNEDDQKVLQQWFGYHLLNSFQEGKMMIFIGSGANGKSVISNLLGLFLGRENVSSVPIEQFNNKRTFPMAETVGKLANICDEISQGEIDEATLKNYITGGFVQAEEKFKKPFIFKPTAKLTFSTNCMPKIKDQSDGFWRRVLMLEFKQKITHEKRNPDFLNDNYWINNGELAGIFNWSLEGAKEILKAGKIFESKNSRESLEEKKGEAGNMKTWILKNIEFVEDGILNRTEAFDQYKVAVGKLGLKPESASKFYAEVMASFPEAINHENPKQTSNGRFRGWSKLKLRDSDEHS